MTWYSYSVFKVCFCLFDFDVHILFWTFKISALGSHFGNKWNKNHKALIVMTFSLTLLFIMFMTWIIKTFLLNWDRNYTFSWTMLFIMFRVTTFLEVLFSSNIEVFFSSNINGVIRVISSFFIFFLRKYFIHKKETKTHISKENKKRQCFYALKKHLRRRK